jgi:type I restriction enzyme, S subunit
VTIAPSRRLGELVEILSGFAFDSKRFADEGVMPVVRIRDVGASRSATFYRGAYDPRYVIAHGDLLVAMDGEFRRSRWQGGPALLNQRVCRLASKKAELDGNYLYHYLPAALTAIEDVTPFATVKHLSTKSIANILIPLPRLAEQQRIAGLLDRADDLRAKRHMALAQLGVLSEVVFLEMFGDPVPNPRKWRRVGLAGVAAGKSGIKAGPFGSALKKHEYTASGYRVYGQEQVIAGRFDIGNYHVSPAKYAQLKACAISDGDLLISLVGSFGRVLVVPPGTAPGIINPRLLKITPDQSQVIPEFLAAQLALPSLQAALAQNAHGGTMGVLNAALLKRTHAIVPPIPLQREYVRRCAHIERMTGVNTRSLSALQALFASLQYRAFRGEL